jgi:hypothetical protein
MQQTRSYAVETSLPRWRRLAIFAVKLIHSLIFLSVAVSVLHIFYAGLTNRGVRWTKLSLGLALGESAIFAANRFTCPLRTLAERLGAESGQVTDIFLPRSIADRIPWIFTPPLLMGIGGLAWRRWRVIDNCGARASQRATPPATRRSAVQRRTSAPPPPAR